MFRKHFGGSNIMSVLELLQQSFPASQILLPSNPSFLERNSSYLAEQQSEIAPAALFLPASREDVAKFLQMVKPFARDGKFAFAIRGGGQNPLPYCANIEKPGVTLDLALLNAVTVKDGSVTIGAGARWGAVYDALDGTGMGVSGSRSSKGGIGGLALQGDIILHSSLAICVYILRWTLLLLVPRRICMRQRSQLRDHFRVRRDRQCERK